MPQTRIPAPIAVMKESIATSKRRSKSKILGIGGGGLVGVGIFSDIVPSQAKAPKERINPPIIIRQIAITYSNPTIPLTDQRWRS